MRSLRELFQFSTPWVTQVCEIQGIMRRTQPWAFEQKIITGDKFVHQLYRVFPLK
jgi:hypothetical protein